MAKTGKTSNSRGLTEQQQRELVETAARGYMQLPTPAKIVVAILGVIIAFFLIKGYLDSQAPSPTAYTDVTGNYAPTEWVEKDSPQYYRVDGAAIVEHPDIKPGHIEYGGIDAYGRAVWAAGRITYGLVEESAGWRCDFTSDAQNNVAGWGHNGEVTIDIPGDPDYTGWLFNRSHLVADSLGGYDHVYKSDGTIDKKKSKSERKNLVTATRTQNVGANDGQGGMAWCEDIAIKYLSRNKDKTLYYSATPVYHDTELLPRSVFVDMKSDDGKVDMHIEVYNAAKGYNIDYATGNWSKS